MDTEEPSVNSRRVSRCFEITTPRKPCSISSAPLNLKKTILIICSYLGVALARTETNIGRGCGASACATPAVHMKRNRGDAVYLNLTKSYDGCGAKEDAREVPHRRHEKYARRDSPLEHRHGQAHAAALADFSRSWGRKHPLKSPLRNAAPPDAAGHRQD